MWEIYRDWLCGTNAYLCATQPEQEDCIRQSFSLRKFLKLELPLV